jgi:hypothetical protein
MILNKITFFLIAASAFIILLIVGWFLVFRDSGGVKLNTDRASVIREMRSLQRFETAIFTIEKIIDGGTSGNVFQQFLFGDKILLIAHGQVIAGFDLSQISEKDVEVEGTTIRITLPKPQVLVTTLDNTQTKVYDRSRGILSPGDKDLESKARAAAEDSIKKAACDGGILKQASDNARKQISAFLSALGFSQISIDIPEGSC